MKHTKLTVVILFISLFLFATPQNDWAQDNPNTITFDNKSGKSALVMLLGPTPEKAEVPNMQSRTVNVASGEYSTLVQYGSNHDKYYIKGDPFTVTQTATQYSAITITLHKTYVSYPTSAEEKKIKSCEDECKGMLEKGELKKGMGIRECIQILCRKSIKNSATYGSEQFSIKDKHFEATGKSDCGTYVSIISVQGDKITTGGPFQLSFNEDGILLWCYGATHTWTGKLTYAGYTFDSDKGNPLQFMVDEEIGYLYVKGKGVVVMPNGRTVELPPSR